MYCSCFCTCIAWTPLRGQLHSKLDSNRKSCSQRTSVNGQERRAHDKHTMSGVAGPRDGERTGAAEPDDDDDDEEEESAGATSLTCLDNDRLLCGVAPAVAAESCLRNAGVAAGA